MLGDLCRRARPRLPSHGAQDPARRRQVGQRPALAAHGAPEPDAVPGAVRPSHRCDK